MKRGWKNKVNVVLFAGAIAFLSSCAGDPNKRATGNIEIPDSIFSDQPMMISAQAMNDIIDNISSPVEMAALLKSSGVPFSQKILASTDNVDKLNTEFKQAINLGIYGCDLGYLNMYEKTGSVISNMQAIKTLSNELRIGQFFDFNTIKRLATNNENIDSLMYISVSSFTRMDEFLRQNNRSSVSSLIVAGMWLEGMYLITQLAKESGSKEIRERIADQKVVLNELLLILKNYKSIKSFGDLVEEVELIKKHYEGVKITYEMGDPETKEVDGMLTIVQNDKQIINMSDETLEGIISSIRDVRNRIINL